MPCRAREGRGLVYNQADQQGKSAPRGISSGLMARCLLIVVFALAAGTSVRARSAERWTEVHFDIPAQPLADALVAYGKAAGLEVFYDGELAVGRRSAALSGTFTPMVGLHALLSGTGYVPEATAYADAVTIVPEARAAAPLVASPALLNRYDSYFAMLQARIGAALCRGDEAKPRSEQIIFSIWLDQTGAVSRAELVGSAVSPASSRTITEALRGVRIGRLPAGLPQPVTMVVFPPSEGEATGCASIDRRRAAR